MPLPNDCQGNIVRGMRTETDILSDIQSLSTEIDNLRTVSPPESGVALSLQNARQDYTDALKELLDLKLPGWLPPPVEPTPVAAAAAPAATTWASSVKKKK